MERSLGGIHCIVCKNKKVNYNHDFCSYQCSHAYTSTRSCRVDGCELQRQANTKVENEYCAAHTTASFQSHIEVIIRMRGFLFKSKHKQNVLARKVANLTKDVNQLIEEVDRRGNLVTLLTETNRAIMKENEYYKHALTIQVDNYGEGWPIPPSFSDPHNEPLKKRYRTKE